LLTKAFIAALTTLGFLYSEIAVKYDSGLNSYLA